MRVHIIHGIHVSEPKDSIGAIAPYFENYGHEAIVHSYGHITALTARFRNPGIAQRIGTQVRPGDVLIGHSNGCDVIRRIAENGTSFAGAILFNPALDCDIQFAEGIDWIDVYHNRDDVAVALARLLLWHPWGVMGRDGYTGSDPRVTNIDTWADVNRHTEGRGHSGVIARLFKWAPTARRRAEAANLARALQKGADMELVRNPQQVA